MKKILLTAHSILFAAFLFAQTEKFDIASFIAPPNWSRLDTNGMIVFAHTRSVNDLSNLCQIFLYPSRAGGGNPHIDFNTEWKNRVTAQFKTNKKPKIEIKKNAEGWNITTGYINLNESGINYTCKLITASGFGKIMSAMVIMTGDGYSEIVKKFFDNMYFDKNAPETTQNNLQNNGPGSFQTNMSGPVTLNDYDFLTPEGWHVQNNKDHIQIQNMQSGCVIRILEAQLSSGDLEQDTKAVFELMYKGWQYSKTGEQQYTLSKGFLSKGLEYCMMEAAMSMTATDGRYHLEEGGALVVKASNQIVIISVRHNSGLLAHDDCRLKYETWKRFFNSFTIKNITIPKTNEEAISERIIGLWKTSETMALSDYVFAANGKYQHGGAIGNTSTTSDLNYEYIHYKSYSWEGDGSYVINGDQLTLKKTKR